MEEEVNICVECKWCATVQCLEHRDGTTAPPVFMMDKMICLKRPFKYSRDRVTGWPNYHEGHTARCLDDQKYWLCEHVRDSDECEDYEAKP